MTSRINAVFVRKSTQGQDEGGQKSNVANMLRDRAMRVPDEHWFEGTVSRRKVKANLQFNRLMALVEADKIGTVYVESQDRWGTKDRVELYSLLGTLREHGTKLFDLKAGKDLTEKDISTELLAFVNSIKSQKELEDVAYRSLRTRVNLFRDTGSWPTGTHPYGYGKRCLSSEGKLLWEWFPVDRTKGQVFNPDARGMLVPGATDVPIPRKSKGARERTVLIPNTQHPDYIKAVKLVFDLYTRAALSRRQIAVRLNAEGLIFNGGEFTHPDVKNILINPAYAGDTHFGKLQSGELSTFDANGLIVDAKKQGRRDVADRLVRKDTHEALIDRKTFELAQKRLAWETKQRSEGRTNHSPRNPAYWLKQLFVCGHCGKNMAARMNEGKVVYVCSSYVQGRMNGHPVECGYHAISHDDGEQLLLDKIKELNVPFDFEASAPARTNLEARLERLGWDDEEAHDRYREWIEQGLQALVDYLKENYAIKPAALTRLQKTARSLYSYGCLTFDQIAGLPANPTAPLPTGADVSEQRKAGRKVTHKHEAALANFKQAMQDAEQWAIEEARRKLALVKEEHKTLTLKWAKATDAMEGVLKAEIERLEADIRLWQPRIVPLSKRIDELRTAEADRQAERQKLLDEWPALKGREKGEAMRRLFDTVTLFWDKQFHPPSIRPTRPRKTKRKGRWSYSLKKDVIKWAFAVSDLESFR
jgi:hypothetical protein